MCPREKATVALPVYLICFVLHVMVNHRLTTSKYFSAAVQTFLGVQEGFKTLPCRCGDLWMYPAHAPRILTRRSIAASRSMKAGP